jgi:two-component system, NarL family, invasion response regulator UvrY
LSRDVVQTLELTPAREDFAAASSLSAREFEILKLLAQGSSIAEIAEQLGLNQKTVANHQSSIKQKLDVSSATQLMRAAMRLGLVPSIDETR